MSEDMLNDFAQQVEVSYHGETYLVRDNGALCRSSRPGGRKRRLDGEWTFGRPDKSKGYMVLGSHVIHRIVALAFHSRPSPLHVVDHIDTNRRNNRADNLRWVTRLENVLLNPITRARVIRAYGSLEAFFRDPSAVAAREHEFGWMRTVSKAEAQESRRRLLAWAESDLATRGGQLGEWIYRRDVATNHPEPSLDTQSDTPIAIQRNWKIAGEFPACPTSIGDDALAEYAASLKPGTVFYRSVFGDSVSELVGLGDSFMAIVCKMSESSAKDWALSMVTIEREKFVHKSLGSFFTREGALNAHNELLGIDAPHMESIDDYT